MALSENTSDYLLEAEGSLRAALKFAAVNEKPLVISQLSRLIADIESIHSFESLQDIMENHVEGS